MTNLFKTFPNIKVYKFRNFYLNLKIIIYIDMNIFNINVLYYKKYNISNVIHQKSKIHK